MEYIVGYALSYFVESIVLYQYASNIFVPKNTSFYKKVFMLAGIYLGLFCIAACFRNRLVNILAFLLANLFYLIMQYQLNWLLCTFHSALITALMGMCEVTVYVIQEQFAPNFLAFEDTFYGTVLFAIFSKLLFFTAALLVIRVCKKIPVSSPHDRHSALLLIFVPAASVFVMFVFLRMVDGYPISAAMGNMIALSSVFLLLANLLVFGIHQYIEEKNEKNTSLMLMLQKEQNQTEYYEMLRIQNENQRILIHDIKKHLQSIKMLNEKREHEKIHSYIEQLYISSDLQEVSAVCDHKLLNSILCRYKQECQKLHIAFNTDIRSGSLDFMADNDVTALFCNLIDNAVEAASGLPDSYIELSVRIREKTSFVVINVINSCKGDPFQANDNTRLPFTELSLHTKKNNKSSHGFGLKSIRKIVNRYNGDMQMYYNESTNTFHSTITLKS